MLIDWFTVAAQTLNFVILVWLLKRYLYKPIRGAIDAREARIAKTVADALAREKEAGTERDQLAAQNATITRQSAELMRLATEAAHAEEERLIAVAKTKADALYAQRQQAMADQEKKVHDSITRRAQVEILATTRRVLADLADEDLDERIIATFIERIRSLDTSSQSELALAFSNPQHRLTVRTAHPLAGPAQVRLKESIDAKFAIRSTPEFLVDPELVGGIELIGSGQKLAWNISDYLNSLDKILSNLTELSGDSKKTATIQGNRSGHEGLTVHG